MILAVMLLINTALLTAIGLSREKETGTLEQVLVTPIAPPVLMLGKVLPSVVIGLFELLLALAASASIFDLPLRGSLVFPVLVTCLFLLSTLGVGLFVATLSRTQQQGVHGRVPVHLAGEPALGTAHAGEQHARVALAAHAH